MALSIMMIARNAARHLGESLRSVAPIADELVVVDTGSTDNTRQVAAQAGARVLDFAWCDDFAAARNFALDQTRHEWIFSIDADEVLIGDARAPLAAAMASSAPAYLVYQDNVFDNGDVKPNLVARLFRRHSHIRFRNPVHECISENIAEYFPGHLLTPIDVHLRHVGYLAENLAGKHARNLAILEKWVAREPENLFACFKLGNMLWEAGRASDAVRVLAIAYEKLQDVRTRTNAPYLKTFIYIFHESLKAAGEPARAAAFAAVATEWLKSSA
jgi:glycosyltransferase involved in cell wall biosynthesis